MERVLEAAGTSVAPPKRTGCSSASSFLPPAPTVSSSRSRINSEPAVCEEMSDEESDEEEDDEGSDNDGNGDDGDEEEKNIKYSRRQAKSDSNRREPSAEGNNLFYYYCFMYLLSFLDIVTDRERSVEPTGRDHSVKGNISI